MNEDTMMNLYTLFSFHEREDYYFTVIDRKGEIFDKFKLPECRDFPLKNNSIPLKEEFIEKYQLNLDTFLKDYDLYTCYTGGVGELFSQKAVSVLKEELKNEIEFIPCMLKGKPIPVYAALFLKTASIVEDFDGMSFKFENKVSFSAKYAVQDENKGINFVTQAFVELVEKNNLTIECRLQFNG